MVGWGCRCVHPALGANGTHSPFPPFCECHHHKQSPPLETRGRACSLLQVIRVMERMLQEKLSKSAEKPAGGHLSLLGLSPHRDQSLCLPVPWRTTQSPVTPNFHPAGEAPAGELHTLLLAENRRLREELARPPRPPSPPSTPQLPQGTFGGTEKLSLLAKLEEAQARGRAMERQVGITSTPRSGEAQGYPPRAA